MIKLVLFDLDGVLVDTKKMHFYALNEALEDNGYSRITLEDHLSKYDGLPTIDKLEMMGIVGEMQRRVSIAKQSRTYIKLNSIMPNPDITEVFANLKQDEIGREHV